MSFDPYESWLGIPADRRPPTQYDLLGLTPYESDPATIDQAALRRMRKVREYTLSPHSDLAHDILAELARARLILMDAERRAQYDAELRVRATSRRGVSPGGAGIIEPAATRRQGDASGIFGALVVTEPEGDSASSLLGPPRKSHSPWKNIMLVGGFAATLVVLLAPFFHFGPSVSNWMPSRAVQNDREAAAAIPNENPPAPTSRSGSRKESKAKTIIARDGSKTPAREGGSPAPSRTPRGELHVDVDGPPDQGTDQPPATRADPGKGAPRSDSGIALNRPDEVLRRHGLKVTDSRCVLESEEDVIVKAREISRLAEELKLARREQDATVSPKARELAIIDLTDTIDRYRAEINAATRQMDAIHRMPWGERNNSMVFEELQIHLELRNHHEAYLDLAIPYLNRLRRQPFDPQARERVDASVRETTESYKRALDDFRQLVDATRQKYRELDKNDEVKKALDALGRKAKIKPKLGPSHQFEAAAKSFLNPRRRNRGSPGASTFLLRSIDAL
jgi:curved DNA-binding protein CbpA